jgi:integrase
MLTLLSMALEAAKDANLVRVNVAASRLVERPKGSDFKGDAWSEAQVAAFLDHVRGDRYEAAWRVSLCGLRRSEVLGLTWGAIDLDAGTLSVRQSRTPRKGTGIGTKGTVVDKPKRQRSTRTIPLPSGVVASLRSLRRRHEEERQRLGQTLAPDHFVVVDEVGQPIHPDTYSGWFQRVTAKAGLPVIRLHDARRTAATLLATQYGVSGDAAASYLGHDPLTYHRTYVMGDRGHDAVRAALSQMQAGTEGGEPL